MTEVSGSAFLFGERGGTDLGGSDAKSKERGIRFINSDGDSAFLPHLHSTELRTSENINCICIRDRIHIVAQCWNSRTLFRSKRNNARDLADFLEKRFGSKYMIWRFSGDDGISPVFKNVEVFDEPEFDIGLALATAKSVKTWLEMDSKNVAIVEKRGCESKMAFVIACILRYCCADESMASAVSAVSADSILSRPFKMATFLRFLGYFEALFHRGAPEEKHNQYSFYQIIVSNENEEPFNIGDGVALKIYYDGNTVLTIDRPSAIYQDEFYTIFFLDSIDIAGDVKMVLVKRDKAEKKLLEVAFNTFFIKEEMVRFHAGEIDVNHLVITSRVMVDLAMRSKGCTVKLPYTIEDNLMENFKILGDHAFRKEDAEALKKLVERGFNRIVSKFCLQVGMNVAETEDFIQMFSLKGNRNLLMAPKRPILDNIIRVAKVDVLEKPRCAFDVPPCDGETDKLDFAALEYALLSLDYHMETLNLLTENIDEKENACYRPKTAGAKLPPKRKAKVVHETPHAFVRRPLHFVSLSTPDVSVFGDMENLEVAFDAAKFEEWFCESESKKEVKEAADKPEGVLDARRFFLAQLSMKNLEKRKISLDALDESLVLRHKSFQNEDLLNIKRLFLDDKEQAGVARCGIDGLNSTERQMALLSTHTELRRCVDVLLFERSFFEEPQLISQLLHKFETTLSALVDNNAIKVVLKHVLEMVNAITFKYTVNKKKLRSFRMGCLKQLQEYKGKGSDQNLFSFLVDALAKNNPRVVGELRALDAIDAIKDEDLKSLRVRINKYVFDHGVCVAMLREMEGMDSLKEYLCQMLGYAYRFLRDLKDQYRRVMVLSQNVQRRFCDGDEESINTMLRDFSDFMSDLRKALDR